MAFRGMDFAEMFPVNNLKTWNAVYAPLEYVEYHGRMPTKTAAVNTLDSITMLKWLIALIQI